MGRYFEEANVGLIFDMDGVIIDTCNLHEASWKEISTIYGFNWDYDINFKRDVFGTHSVSSANILFKQQLHNHDMEKMCNEKNNIYYSLLRQHLNSIIVPRFHEFFSSVIEAGIPAVLATSSTEEEAEFVLKRLGVFHLFKEVLHIARVKNPKPHPEMYIKACGALGLSPSQCVGFEDSFSGITALGRAGVPCVVVGTTLSYERLSLGGYSFCSYIQDFSEISVNDIIKMYRRTKFHQLKYQELC